MAVVLHADLSKLAVLSVVPAARSLGCRDLLSYWKIQTLVCPWIVAISSGVLPFACFLRLIVRLKLAM